MKRSLEELVDKLNNDDWNDDVKKDFTGLKNFRLIKNQDVEVQVENGVDFLIEVIQYLTKQYSISVKKLLGEEEFRNLTNKVSFQKVKILKTYNEEHKIETKTNTEIKIRTLVNGFKILKEKKNIDISKYNFEVGKDLKKASEKDHEIDNNEIEERNDIKKLLEIDNSKQIIFTGPPGTGKTHDVRKYVKEAENSEYKFIQFHSSYDYSDFIEGLRPVMIKGETSFVRLDGTFKDFCRLIVNDHIDQLKETEEFYEKDNIYIWEEILKNNNELTRSLPPSKKNYYFIIDEINRADLSKVFGELMFGLEDSYRGYHNKFDTQYHNLPTYSIDQNGEAKPLEFDCFKSGFFIPENLHIIGTMNDIDRSVETFDFALRRRFKWIEISANECMERKLIEMNGKELTRKIINNIYNMNSHISSRLELGLNESYHIGPAFFKTYNGNNLEEIWLSRVKPILQEYCRGRNKQVISTFLDECKNHLLDEY